MSVTANDGAVSRENNPKVSTKEIKTVPASAKGNAAWQNFYPEVDGRKNVLHDYNLYNYNITLVALSTDQVNDPSTYKGRVISADGTPSGDFYVVARSGGFGKENRANAAELDLFIENLVFETRCGINNLGQSNLTRGTFEVVEPYSASGFYQELFNAASFAGHPNYLRAPFLLVVQFIGRKVEQDNAETVPKSTRYIPVLIAKSNMSVDEAGARYNVEFLGFNTPGASTPMSTLVSDVEAANQQVATVQSYAYRLFQDHNDEYEQYMAKMRDEVDDTVNRRIQDFLSDPTAQAQAGIGQGMEVRAFMPHKWSVWFPQDMRGSFPTNLNELSYSQWEGIAQQYTIPQNGGANAGAPYRNYVGDAVMLDTLSSGGNVSFPDQVEQVESGNEEIRLIQNQIDEQLGPLNAALATAKAELETLANLAKAYGVYPEELPSVGPDTTIENRGERAADEADRIADQASDLATRIAAAQASGVEPDPAAGGFDPNQSTGDLPSADGQAFLISEQLSDVRSISSSIATLEEQRIALGENVNETMRAPTGSRIDSRGRPFIFKKGSSLLSNIDYLILNSDFTHSLVDADKGLNEIGQNQYVKWYRVEVFQKIIGFDPFTMNHVYEFHYIVQPYQIHYSKLPGVNIIFRTDWLREHAIREYNYIYTGKNIDVLKFDIQYNNLFFTPMVFSPPDTNYLTQNTNAEPSVGTVLEPAHYESNIQTLVRNRLGNSGYLPSPAIRTLSRTALPTDNKNQVAMAFQEFLYNPPAEQALIRAEIEIIGDPVYIIGSGIVDRPRLDEDDLFTEDGEMNTFTRDPHFVFNFRFAKDLPSHSELESKPYMKLTKDQYSGLYQVIAVENRFSDGVFTQRLMGLRPKNQEIDFEATDQAIQNANSSLPT